MSSPPPPPPSHDCHHQGKGLGRQGEGIVRPLGIDFKAPSRNKELLGLGHEERNEKAQDKKREVDEHGNPIPTRKRRRGGRKNKKNKDAGQHDKEQPAKKKSDLFGFLNGLGQPKAETDGAEKKNKGSAADTYKKMDAKELQERLRKKMVDKEEVSAKIKHLEESAQRNKTRCGSLHIIGTFPLLSPLSSAVGWIV